MLGRNEVGWFHTLGRAGWVLHSEFPNVMSALHVRPFFGGVSKVNTSTKGGDATSLIRSIKASGLHGPPPGGAILVIKLK